MSHHLNKYLWHMMAGFAIVILTACSPTVKVEAPDKPIEINMNIKIEQEVRIKVERDLDNLFEESPDLFGTTAN
ncbi:MAG: YnbE family lipoprotein [Alphaproteobacteria bacterium]|nr:MAG: YnbE family lipoprotein [Alphaproteobacteria bacterium]